MLGRFTKQQVAPEVAPERGEAALSLVMDAPEIVAPIPEPAATPANPLLTAKLLDAKVRLHRRLIEEINLSALEKLPEAEIRRHVAALVSQYVVTERLALNSSELDDFVLEILDEMTGLGPIEPLLKDPTVNDILINGHECVYVERQGMLEPTLVRFKDEAHLLRIINKIGSAVGRRVDESQPLCDARLLDGSRTNIEGKGEIRQRELVKNALRMRPDRIILGECRGEEAFDMLQAMNTGHEGSMATVHANTPRDAISRLEQMIGMAGLPMTVSSIRGQIAAAIRVIVQLQRMSDGKRRVMSIAELTGLEGDIIQMQEIYKYVRTATLEDGTVQGHFQATGIRPRFLVDLQAKGIKIPGSYFDPSQPL